MFVSFDVFTCCSEMSLFPSLLLWLLMFLFINGVVVLTSTAHVANAKDRIL